MRWVAGLALAFAAAVVLTEYGLEALLFVVQVALLALLYPVAWILTRAAWQKPREWALTLMALVVDAITLVVTVFVIAAINNGLGAPIDIDIVRIGIRGSFIPLELFGLLFLAAYRRRWFRGEASE